MWSWGGKEVEADGKTVNINNKDVIESVKFMTAFWKDAFDEGGLAWDDSNNNRAFLSGTIAATLNGASIYIELLRRPDQYKTDKGAQLKTDILHAPLPKGPAGQFAMHTYHSHCMPSYSKNQKAAKDFLKWMHTKANYEKWFMSQKGFATPPTAEWEKHKVWDEDPVMTPYKVAGKLGLAVGLFGPREPQGRRGAVEVHHHRHVREGRAGRDARGRREVGRVRAEEGLRLIARARPAAASRPRAQGARVIEWSRRLRRAVARPGA